MKINKRKESFSNHVQSHLKTKLLIGTLLIALVLSLIVLSSVPPVSRDALTHHLIVPKLYIKFNGIEELPYISFSYYPMNLDILYWFALKFWNDIIPKYIHLLFGLLTAWLIFRYIKERLNTLYAFAGALFFYPYP